MGCEVRCRVGKAAAPCPINRMELHGTWVDRVRWCAGELRRCKQGCQKVVFGVCVVYRELGDGALVLCLAPFTGRGEFRCGCAHGVGVARRGAEVNTAQCAIAVR